MTNVIANIQLITHLFISKCLRRQTGMTLNGVKMTSYLHHCPAKLHYNEMLETKRWGKINLI